MEWVVRYKPDSAKPWSVYVDMDDNAVVFKRSFENQEQAAAWVEEERQRIEGGWQDAVDEASLESFPASDAPGWTDSIVR